MYPTFFDAMTTRVDADARFRAAEQVGAVLFVTMLTAIAAQISVPLPFTPVPFTFQPMVVYPLIAVLYFALCWPISLAALRLERRIDAALGIKQHP